MQQVLRLPQLYISFRRALVGVTLANWTSLIQKTRQVTLTNQKDEFKWGLHQNGIFSVKSTYRAILTAQALPFNMNIWKIKIPLKIKVFMWYLYKGVTLTRDNLARKNWNGNTKCCFCNIEESIQHLFFNCPLAKFIWRILSVTFIISYPSNFQHMFTDWLYGIAIKEKRIIWCGVSAICWAICLCRNNVVFDNHPTPSFLQVIFRGTYWARFWTLLLKEDDRPVMKTACRVVETIAMEVFSNNG